MGNRVTRAIAAILWIGFIHLRKTERAKTSEARATLGRAIRCDFRQYEQVEKFLSCVQELQRLPFSVLGDQMASLEGTLTLGWAPGSSYGGDGFSDLDKLYFVNRVFYEVPEAQQGRWRLEVLPGYVSLGGGGARFGPFASPSEEFAAWQSIYQLRNVQDLIDRGKVSEDPGPN